MSDRHYEVEVVSPVLQYEDIELVQQVVRAIRKRGAKVNPSCATVQDYHRQKELHHLFNQDQGMAKLESDWRFSF